MADNSYTDIMEKNHMEIPWHDYARQDGNILIDKAGLIEKASVIGVSDSSCSPAAQEPGV